MKALPVAFAAPAARWSPLHLRMSGIAKEVWAYRSFISGSVKREFQSKYRNSLLGAAWTILQPLSMVAIYTILFTQVMQARLPGVTSSYAYGIHVCAGMLSWGLFAEIVGRGQTLFIDNANLIKKLKFPRICLPVIAVLNAALNFSIIFGLFVAFLVVIGHFPGWPVAALVPILALEVAFAIGLGVLLGVLNVFFRDVGHSFGILFQFWFWFTPIVYPATILPEGMRSIVSLNPMTGLIGAYQEIFVAGRWPHWPALIPAMVFSTLACAFALRLFARRAGEMVDEL
jgi:lipopolysaccharide transport system permease protein